MVKIGRNSTRQICPQRVSKIESSNIGCVVGNGKQSPSSNSDTRVFDEYNIKCVPEHNKRVIVKGLPFISETFV